MACLRRVRGVAQPVGSGMSALSIEHVALTGRLPGTDAEARARAERLVRRACDSALARACDEAGLDRAGTVCIRALDVPLHVPLGLGDDDVAELWSRAVAEAVREALARGGPAVMVYGSPAQALLDVLRAAPRGDLSRAWAWRQLGLWTHDAWPKGLERALLAHPELSVAALRAVAEADALPVLSRALPGATWARVAQAALRAAGASNDAQRALREGGDETTAAALGARARRITADSALWRAVRPGAAWLGPLARRAWAALTIAECEPLTLRAAHAVALLHELSVALASGTRVGEMAPARPQARQARQLHEASGPDAPDAPRTREGDAPSVQAAPPDAASTDEPVTERAEAGSGVSEPVLRAPIEIAADPISESSQSQPAPRAQASTRFGGLLYLLNLMGPLGLPQTLAEHAALQSRSSRDVLRLLALTLLRECVGVEEVDVDDPAVRAFAGLVPLPAQSPSTLEEADVEAGIALHAAAAALDDALVELLGTDALEVGSPSERPLTRVVLRRALIVADPGWIEAHFALDDVDTALRRIGLDRDPGYLPFLGAIVKFRYV